MLNNSACLYTGFNGTVYYAYCSPSIKRDLYSIATTSYCTTTVPYTVRLPDSVDLPTPALTSAGAGMWPRRLAGSMENKGFLIDCD